MLKAGGDTYEKENDFIAAGPGIIVQRCCLRANGYGRRPIRDGRRNSVLYDQRGANARTNFKGNADAGAKRANHANARAGKTQKPEKTTKATAKPKATKKATTKPKVTKKPQNNADSSATVYITDTGKKYHRAGCRSLVKSKHAISRANAKARGYSPCRVCKP